MVCRQVVAKSSACWLTSARCEHPPQQQRKSLRAPILTLERSLKGSKRDNELWETGSFHGEVTRPSNCSHLGRLCQAPFESEVSRLKTSGISQTGLFGPCQVACPCRLPQLSSNPAASPLHGQEYLTKGSLNKSLKTGISIRTVAAQVWFNLVWDHSERLQSPIPSAMWLKTMPSSSLITAFHVKKRSWLAGVLSQRDHAEDACRMPSACREPAASRCTAVCLGLTPSPAAQSSIPAQQ